MLGLSLGLNAGVNVRRALPFTPASLSGLAAWYDLQDESTVSLVNSNEVDSIADKSGNGWDLSYVSTAATSLRDLYGDYFNGKKSITVADEPTTTVETGHYYNGSFPAFGNSEREIFYVAKDSSTGTNALTNPIATIGIPSGNTGLSNGMGLSPGLLSVGGYGTRLSGSLGSQFYVNNVVDQIGSLRLESGGTTLNDYIFETSSGVIPSSTSNSTVIDTVGGIGFFIRLTTSTGDRVDRTIGEFVVFDRALTSEERAQMFAYLHGRWDSA